MVTGLKATMTHMIKDENVGFKILTTRKYAEKKLRRAFSLFHC